MALSSWELRSSRTRMKWEDAMSYSSFSFSLATMEAMSRGRDWSSL